MKPLSMLQMQEKIVCKVVVYTSSTCAPCRMLKKVLDQNYVDYEEVLVESKSGSELLEIGITSVPVTFVGQTKFIGATQDTIKKILDKTNEGV